tara:strand:- start:928 stop:1212 length:285 start_codon:yes stop_codon:yes gene_type:complete
MSNQLDFVKTFVQELNEEELNDLSLYINNLKQNSQPKEDTITNKENLKSLGWNDLPDFVKSVKLEALKNGHEVILPSDAPAKYLTMENCSTYQV